MMHPAALALASYSAQILFVVSVAAAAAALLCRRTTPAMRLAYWRVVGVLCLLLPLLAPVPREQVALSVAFVSATIPDESIVPIEPTSGTMSTVVLWIWAGGVCLGLARLVMAAWGLRQRRRQSTPVTLGKDVEALRNSLAPHAEFRWSPALQQPVTFGMRRPVILLPPRFRELSTEAQRAVAHHELLQVARRDWMWVCSKSTCVRCSGFTLRSGGSSNKCSSRAST